MKLQLTVPDLACSACSEKISNAIKAIDPTATIQADPQTKQVNIETQVPAAKIEQAITDAGYSLA
jgi:copper chaperone